MAFKSSLEEPDAAGVAIVAVFIRSKLYSGVSVARRVSISRWDEMSLERITEMVSRKVIAGARQTLAQFWLKRGALVARHAHSGEQITYVLDGALRYSVDGEDVLVRAGDVLVIPPGAKHQVTVLDDSLII